MTISGVILLPRPQNGFDFDTFQYDEHYFYDTDFIYTRVIDLQQSRDINIKEVLTYELSPVPPALIDEGGDMRIQGIHA